MNGKGIAYIIGGVLLLAGIVWIVLSISGNEPPDISGKVHLIKEETVELRFKVVSNSNNEMLLAGKFFDLDGNVVGRFEQPYNSNGPIGVQFLDIDIKGRHVVFPQLLIVGENEIPLHEYYNNGGFPQVYNSTLLDSTLREGIGYIFNLLEDGQESKVANQYGNVNIITNQTDLPREGANYEWHVTSEGHIFFLKNN